jgi:hypothetical protein
MRILIFTSLLLLCFSCKKEKPTEIQQPNFKYYDFFSSSLRATAVNSENLLFHIGYGSVANSGRIIISNLPSKDFVTESSFYLSGANFSNQCAASIGREFYTAVNSYYTGQNKYDPIINIFNSAGQLLNSFQFNDPNSEVIQDLIVTKDSNLLIFSIDGDNPVNVILRKCNKNGDLLWVKNFETSYYSYNIRVVELNDGRFAYVPNSTLNNTVVLTILDATEDEVESKLYNFTPSLNEPISFCKTIDGNITLISSVTGKIWMACIDPLSGNNLWENQITLNNIRISNMSITPLNDGTYAIIGACNGNLTRSQDVLYAHINSTGKVMNFKVFGGPRFDFPQHITHIGNNELYISGEYTGTNIFNNGRALFNVRLKADGTFLP